MMYESVKRCESCKKDFIVKKNTLPELRRSMIRLKYCPDCRKAKAQEQKRASYIRKDQPAEPSPFGSRAEWDAGFKKFWAKRGMEEPHEPFNPPYTETH